MEHMRAQIQHGLPLTDRSFAAWVRGCHILWAGVLKIEPLDKVRNPVNEMCLLKSCAEALLWQVAQADEQVDQNWGRDASLQQCQDTWEYFCEDLGALLKPIQDSVVMEYVSHQSGAEIETKRVYVLLLQWPLKQADHPLR